MKHPEPPSDYFVDLLPIANQQIRTLGAKAVAAGRKNEFLQALKSIAARLAKDPLSWGDPENTTKKSGGLVCHGVQTPLFVHFVVYEDELVVIVLKVMPMPGTYVD